MFGNIDATRALIARMQPAQLKQFAMMHKDDMITMSLISEVQSKRNQAKLFQQAQQANAMPPKVNQQVLQSLQAEDSGLAALPADNITYADGGIVGYAGGGTLATSGGIPEQMPGESWADYRQRVIELQDRQEQARAQAKREQAEAERIAEIARRGGPRVSPFLQQSQATGSIFTPGGESGLRPDMSAAQAQTDSTRPGVVTRKAPPPARTAPSATTTKTPSAAPAEAPSAAPAADEAPSYEELFRKAQTAAGVGKPVDPYAAERAKNADILKAQNEEELADARARKEGLASLLKPREERIAQREAALEKQSETDKNMAIISAGLAMMQSTGKGISGIAEGAAKGFAQYGEAMKLNKAERQKILEARDAYDEFKYNAENMSQKEITAARRKIAEGAVAASNQAIEALMNQNNLNRADGTALFKAQFDDIQERKKEAASMARTQAEIAGREKVAQINKQATILAANGRLGTQEATLALNTAKALLAEAEKTNSKYAGKILLPKDREAARQAAENLEAAREAVRKLQPGGSTMPPSPDAKAPASTSGTTGSWGKMSVK